MGLVQPLYKYRIQVYVRRMRPWLFKESRTGILVTLRWAENALRECTPKEGSLSYQSVLIEKSVSFRNIESSTSKSGPTPPG